MMHTTEKIGKTTMNYRETKGEDKMKREKGIGSSQGIMAWLPVVFVIMVFMAISPVYAVTCPTTSELDADNDGFKDALECSGITFKGTAGGTFPSCSGTTLTRDACLDPNTPDLFVILIRANDPGMTGSYTLIPSNPLQFVSAPRASGGLGLAVHIITRAQADASRIVSTASTQKAVRVTESLDTSSTNEMGSSNVGTPNGNDAALVYTQRIKNQVTSVYTGVSQSPPAGFIDTYIRHTIAHEVAHMTGPLATTYNSNVGGHHYRSGTNLILDQSVSYKITGSTVTWNLGTTYSAADQGGIRLKP